ncbi:MAG: low molecular weight protein-tyrosine-phosphatase [Bacteroidales bacterium]
MVNILFVCTGNICRSPMAEGILKDKLKHLHFQAEVDSCGFESFHVGDAPDSRAQEVAKERGIDISSHRARLFTMKDFDRFDYIYAMDSSHYNNIIRLARNDADVEKVDYLLNVLSPGQNTGVQDPWYHDMKAFERVYIQLEEACKQITLNLVNQPHK